MYPLVFEQVTTIAGELESVSKDISYWHLSLDGKPLIANDGNLPPGILKHVTSRVAPFDEVVVLWQETGTCCEFGRFWFLGLKADKSFYLSKPIGEGFAHVPDVIVGDDYVKVKIRSGYMHNPEPGTGYLPGGAWLFRNGRVTKQK